MQNNIGWKRNKRARINYRKGKSNAVMMVRGKIESTNGDIEFKCKLNFQKKK